MKTTAVAALTLALSTLVHAQSPPTAQGDSAWWQEAKFGMFIHWGVYAVPADHYNKHGWPFAPEWFLMGKQMTPGEYETFAPQFNPVDFDAKTWVRIAKDAGMKYITITSKHHDGFCMFDSKLTDYDIIDATPFKRDPLKELAKACAEAGITLQFYYSIMDWHHPDYLPRRDFDHRPADTADLNRYLEYQKGQLTELLTNYGDIAGLWFDGGWEHTAAELKSHELVRYLRTLRPGLMINDRTNLLEDYETPEQSIPAAPPAGRLWETCMTLNDYWGYARGDDSWKSTTDLIRKLVDIASKGGNFLLNVGPDERGMIPAESVRRLQQVGAWMKVNGESIYGSTRSPYRRYDFNGRCTVKSNTLYVHVFGWPDAGVTLRGLVHQPLSARLLDGGQSLAIRSDPQDDGTFTVHIPRPAQPDLYATVIALQLPDAADVRIIEPPIQPDALSGNVGLSPVDATLHGQGIRIESRHDVTNIGYWTGLDQWASWQIQTEKTATYEVALTYACHRGYEGGQFTLATSGGGGGGGGGGESASITATTAPTGNDWDTYRTVTLGKLTLPAGRHTIEIRPTHIPAGALMNLAGITLTKLQ